MKDIRLTVRIQKPTSEVFAFTTDPANTPRWIDSIAREEVDSHPVKIGSVYRNWSKDGSMNEYVVTQHEPFKVFQLDATHQDYRVRYTYTPISDSETELEYYEWSESGQLHAPFMQKILDTLREVMEAKTTES